MLEQLILVGACAFAGILAFYKYGDALKHHLHAEAELIEGRDLPNLDVLDWLVDSILAGSDWDMDFDSLGEMGSVGAPIQSMVGSAADMYTEEAQDVVDSTGDEVSPTSDSSDDSSGSSPGDPDAGSGSPMDAPPPMPGDEDTDGEGADDESEESVYHGVDK